MYFCGDIPLHVQQTSYVLAREPFCFHMVILLGDFSYLRIQQNHPFNPRFTICAGPKCEV